MVQRVEIASKVEELGKQITAWDNGTVQELSPEILQGIRALGELVQTEDVQPTAYELVLAIDEFVIATDQWWREHDLSTHVDDRPSKPGGSDRMWTLWGQVVKLAPERPKSLPKPAILLKDQRVPDAIIAQKYRFIDQHGRPDLVKVSEHLMAERRGEPSPHYDPETFIAPQDEQYAAKWAERWQGRAERLAKLGIRLLAAKKSSGRRGPLPDIGDLAHKSSMTIEVLARKLGISKAEAEQQLAARGIVLEEGGSRFFDPAIADQSRRAKDSDDREKLQHVDTYESLGDNIEERIRAMAEDRYKPQTIARALTLQMTREGKPAVTYQKVQKVLKDAKAVA